MADPAGAEPARAGSGAGRVPPVSAPPASGVITITTDFGHQGPFVGVMKGCILTRFPQARIIDLTHEIVVHWPAEAGFWLARAFGYFPAGTVHVAVVDPGVGTSRDIVAVHAAGHYFLAPDNGLLAPIVSRARDALHRAPERRAARAHRRAASERHLPRPGYFRAGGRRARGRALPAAGAR